VNALSLRYKGYCGKILRVNLTSKKTSEQRLSNELVRAYLGGNGIAARIIYDEVSPTTDAFSPENKLVFMTGPANGAHIPFASKFGAWSISPLTGHFHDSMSSGFLASEIKYAGYDGFIFEGHSEKPVYIWVDDDVVQFKDASHLWGKGTHESQEMIREDLRDPGISTCSIGPAGEKLVRYASILVGTRALGRSLGGVMGS